METSILIYFQIIKNTLAAGHKNFYDRFRKGDWQWDVILTKDSFDIIMINSS